MNFAGARVWVTGGSSGIGEALLAPLTQLGARVAITARNAGEVERAAARFSATERPVLGLPGDVTDRDTVHTIVERIEKAWGGVDLAILNAGTYRAVNETSLNAEDFVSTFQVNYFGVIYAIEAVLPGMLARGHGRVAATSSLAGLLPLPNAAAYGASKAALTYTLQSLRLGLASRGIGMTVILPGFVRTPLTANNRFPMPGLMGPQDAAALIMRGLLRDDDEIAFPGRLAVAVKAAQRLPYRVVERALRRAGNYS